MKRMPVAMMNRKNGKKSTSTMFHQNMAFIMRAATHAETQFEKNNISKCLEIYRMHEVRKAKELAHIQDNPVYQDAQENVSAGTNN